MLLLNLYLRLLLVLISINAFIGITFLGRDAFQPFRRCGFFYLSDCGLQVVRQDCLHLALGRVGSALWTVHVDNARVLLPRLVPNWCIRFLMLHLVIDEDRRFVVP